MPGFLLAKKVYETYQKNPEVNCLILLNHGIFTFSNSAKESYDLMIKNVTIAESAIKKMKSKKIKQVRPTMNTLHPSDIAPILRGLLTDDNKDDTFIINFRLNKDIKYFMNGVGVKKYSHRGTVTPDHVIRIKPYPLVIDITPKMPQKFYRKSISRSKKI